MSASERLSRLQVRAIASLLVCRTISEAAETVGVGESTLRRWLGSDDFRAAYRQAARESAQRATTALWAAQDEAVAVLRECMQTGSPATRVRAARCVLELGIRVAEDDVAERLADLEREVSRWAEPAGRLKLA